MSSHDGLLFLLEAFYFLLDPDQLLLLIYSLVFFCFFILVVDLDLLKLSVALDASRR
jgi:hypothetical protein